MRALNCNRSGSDSDCGSALLCSALCPALSRFSPHSVRLTLSHLRPNTWPSFAKVCNQNFTQNVTPATNQRTNQTNQSDCWRRGAWWRVEGRARGATMRLGWNIQSHRHGRGLYSRLEQLRLLLHYFLIGMLHYLPSLTQLHKLQVLQDVAYARPERCHLMSLSQLCGSNKKLRLLSAILYSRNLSDNTADKAFACLVFMHSCRKLSNKMTANNSHFPLINHCELAEFKDTA